MAEQPTATGTVMGEIGRTGLRHSAGIIQEEFLPALRGSKGVSVYGEMRDNDPIVNAVMLAIESQLLGLAYPITPYSEDAEDKQKAEWVEGALDDMSSTWDEVKSEAISFLQYGWSYLELCYKLRQGEDGDPESQHDDGFLGWRKMPIRSQDTLDHWEIDEDGGIQGMHQGAGDVMRGGARTTLIPIEKAWLLRTHSRKNNPEGRSILRSAYRPWYYKRRIEEFRAVGIERDLVGVPHFEVPARVLDPAATGLELAVREAYQQIGENLRNNEQTYLMTPLSYDAQGNPEYVTKLLSSPGTKMIDTNPVIEYYSREIAQSVLADVIIMGHEKVGTQSLAGTKDDMFTLALQSWANDIASGFNRHVLPKLFRLNGWSTTRMPKMEAGEVGTINLKDFGAFIKDLAGAGYPLFPDGELERWIADQAEMPHTPMEERESLLRTADLPQE